MRTAKELGPSPPFPTWMVLTGQRNKEVTEKKKKKVLGNKNRKSEDAICT